MLRMPREHLSRRKGAKESQVDPPLTDESANRKRRESTLDVVEESHGREDDGARERGQLSDASLINSEQTKPNKMPCRAGATSSRRHTTIVPTFTFARTQSAFALLWFAGSLRRYKIQ